MNLNKHILYLLFLGLAFTACNDASKEKSEDKKETTQDSNKLSEEALLDTVQKQTLKYFWDFAEPNSGMARERYHPNGDYGENDPDIVTTGGSGFGLMAIVAGVERGFIPRAEAVKRFDKIATFLEETPKYHGAFPHWINGRTAGTQEFGNDSKDNGGDIVETSFLAQGFLVVRQYLQDGNEEEKAVAAKFDKLWENIEWDWYTNNKNGIFWHWSPNYEFQKNFMIEGYNECLITYIMAASSPGHGIKPAVYHDGWARSGNITTDKKAYGIPLILKFNTNGDKAGPLFWAHYSYLGLNPKGLSDRYANYWDLNVNHSNINYEYAQENPSNFKTYSENSWGLTASYTKNEDGSVGYTAHSPDDDKGVVAPTAAVSSIPYTPKKSLKAMRYFYEDQHDLLWGPAGFYDAFSLDGGDWVAERYLAIDQGPMMVMIENYRSGLIWDLFMSAPEVKNGLERLDFKR
ncbi:glucoamylase family protein [Zunongwangia endophytica]|uniref:Glucoamylase family protein n=1 Tax=Zunongwangia endophytica TaxID=1808945 RepID=A0ABV8HAN5_9FLAO|nr:glucoamylase family protein [Zunongwangia endophytica]MDN3595177.1 glucoamylase family protein [Zunongwangia endophytica]